MKEIRLTRSFLSKPINSILILLGIILLIEAVSWSIGYAIKLEKVAQAGGFLSYVGLVVRVLFLPELVTLIITIALVNRYHKWFKLGSVENDWQAVGLYELKFLPVLGMAFWIFNPFTQTVRYILEQFPTYSLSDYLTFYLVGTYNWATYFKYLFPVILIGYIALNISLLSDFLKQRREAQEAAEAKATKAAQEALALSATFVPKPTPTTPSPYLTQLKGKNGGGELTFPINEVCFFTVEDRSYYAELTKGRYLVSKTLNELETEVDPSVFFRIKRDYIINRQAVQHYSYWENGKYIVRLNTPDAHEIIVPRARMQEFREWLQNTQSSQTDTATDSFVLTS